ncbi:hypothetical protein [Paracoccus benzoatiresistens]|uniref:Uncharacterized protein n=1 Tax=Paracoccus benzoatiresistens TaxID=2997341 RepID=A0ABT4J1I6_9RHOB|nr:hypothetical protein [Paracoccus sp. EF6]MCZ0960281.1 hypothetical protein [Paracoccus sp. EF6]
MPCRLAIRPADCIKPQFRADPDPHAHLGGGGLAPAAAAAVLPDLAGMALRFFAAGALLRSHPARAYGVDANMCFLPAAAAETAAHGIHTPPLKGMAMIFAAAVRRIALA